MLTGPYDVGGTCPKMTKKRREILCCCGEYWCCWNKCTWDVPPEDCLKEVPNSQWVYNYRVGYYMAVQNWNGYNKSIAIFDQNQWVRSGMYLSTHLKHIWVLGKFYKFCSNFLQFVF